MYDVTTNSWALMSATEIHTCLQMGNSKTGATVQISQWYECNDANLHGDIEKFIRRRKNESEIQNRVKWD